MGCEKVRDECEESFYQLGFRAGVKEVVGWAKRYEVSYEEFGNERYLPNRIQIPRANWEAKLKEWDIK